MHNINSPIYGRIDVFLLLEAFTLGVFNFNNQIMFIFQKNLNVYLIDF